MAITTLLLDADGVLQHPPASWMVSLLRLTGTVDLRAIAAVEQPTMTGRTDPRDAFESGFPQRRCSVDELLAFWNDTIVDAQCLELVDAVRARGVRCYLASNQQRYRAAWMRADLPYADHLDGLFFSSEVGLAKPDPAFFRRICGEIGAAAGETLFIDDMSENVAGARTAGLVAERKSRAVGARGLRRILVAHDLL